MEADLQPAAVIEFGFSTLYEGEFDTEPIPTWQAVDLAEFDFHALVCRPPVAGS